MRKLIYSLGFAVLLALTAGCGASTKELGPAEETPEMSDEQKANMEKEIERSMQHMPPEMRKKYKENMKKTQ